MVETDSYRGQKQLDWMSRLHLQKFQLIVKGQLDPADVLEIDDGLIVWGFHRHAQRQHTKTLPEKKLEQILRDDEIAVMPALIDHQLPVVALSRKEVIRG